MACIERNTCLLCENKVYKLLRHIKLVHSEATPELRAELVASQRKKRSDSLPQSNIGSVGNIKKTETFVMQ